MSHQVMFTNTSWIVSGKILLQEAPNCCKRGIKCTLVPPLVKFATFEFATYILGSMPTGKVQKLAPGRGKRKRTRNIYIFFLVGLREYF